MSDNNQIRKVTADEFEEAMRNGAKIMGVQQIVKNADGNQTTRTIYGKVPGEGDNIDRSIHVILADDEYLQPFFQSMINGEYADVVLDPTQKKTIIATFDETRDPLTYMITLSPDKIKLDGYVRDIQRSYTESVLSGEWQKEPDGTMEITGERLQDDHDLVRAVVFMMMLKFLKAKGILDELQRLGNPGAAALVEIKNGKPQVRIIRGSQRPDLPCAMLFMDEPVMARPYIDEQIGELNLAGMGFDETVQEAEGGDENAMEHAAMAYLNGDGVEKDAEKAAHWFRKLAESGSPAGMFNYGLFCAKGYGVKRDFAEAAKWMRKADEAGDEDAAALVEKFDQMNRLTPLAAQGKPAAQGELAGLYMMLAGSLEQAGTGDDYKKAFELATKAGEQDDPTGLWTLALAYEHGRGVKASRRMAIECYERSANLGYARAKNSLGCFYLRGEVPGHTKKEGFELVKQAAEAGDPEGMANVGKCYQFANGVEYDMDKAIEWYEKALDAGLNDPELAQKVPIFKHMQQIPTDHKDGDPYEGMDLPFNFEPMKPWDHIKEHMSWQDNDNIEMLGVAKKRRQPDEKPEGFFIDPIEGGVRIIDIEISNTQFQGRVQRIERIHVGDAVKIGSCTTRNDRLEVFTMDGQSLGELSHGGDFIFDVLKEGSGEVTGAKVSYVVPVSKRGSRARKAELYIDVDLKRTDGKKAPTTDKEDAKTVGDGCVVYHLEGDQTNMWAQKLTVMHLNMSMKRAKGLFELYNRYNDEYGKAAQGDAADTGYAGLSNLVDEICAARAKMRAQAAGGNDYSKMEAGVVPESDARYDGIEWDDVDETPLSITFFNLFNRRCRQMEEYYWLDQTRVDKETYEASTFVLHHHYEIMELMDPHDLPFNPDDPEMVSIFGFGRFIAFADLSYGC